MSDKIKVLVVPSDKFGVGMYRSTSPHKYLTKNYGDDFDVTVEYTPNWGDKNFLSQFDIIHFHKGLYRNMEEFWDALKYCKENNITTVMDIDDNFILGPQHPAYQTNKMQRVPEKIMKNFSLADYVTTTTEIFANKIRKYNKNVLVFPNAIDPTEEQYLPIKNPSKRIRFGFVMGSSHEKDMEQLAGIANVIKTLGQEFLDKIQIVLCGFDLRGNINFVDKDGNFKGSRPIMPKESVWYRYEKLLTNDYSIVSPQYKDFLNQFINNAQWPDVDNEPYRREWTKDITNFATHYRNIDVLFAPLDENDFNLVKSELKFIEGGFTRTAVVASNFGPYTIGSKSLFQYGGGIDENANCILIDSSKAHKMWAKAIKELVKNPELITLLQNNMYEHVKDTYNINNVTDKRAEWYKSIVKKK